MPDNFDLEYQYQLYLQRMSLKEETTSEDQKRETRRAFMGACGQMLILMRDDLPQLSEEDGIKAMERMIEQVMNFFLKETGKQN